MTACSAHGLGAAPAPPSADVHANGVDMLRHGDRVCTCGAVAIQGSTTVFINQRKAQRIGVDLHNHGGTVLNGSTNVFLGSPAQDAALWAQVTPPECAYLEKWASVTSADPMYDPPAKGLDRLRAPYQMDPAKPGIYRFGGRSQPEATVQYDVTVRGHKVTIIQPVAAPAPGQVAPTPAQLSAAIALLPDSALTGVDTVVISPIPSTVEDPTQPPAIASTDAEQRKVTFYPRSPNDGHGAIKSTDVDWAMVHEGGHVSDPNGAQKDAIGWAQAMAQDAALSHRGVSIYGNTNYLEDYAESVLMYALTVNTPCEGTARRLFPHRYAILERQYSHSFPTLAKGKP